MSASQRFEESGSPVVLSSSGSAVRKSPHRLRSAFLWLCVFCFLLSALYFLRAPLLRAVANAWMINELPTKADAIVVLGGAAQDRSFEAARLYHAGLAPTILVMNSELRATDSLGLTIPEAELVRRLLLTNGVPLEAVHTAGTNLTSTFEEALTVKRWSEASHATSFLIPTGSFHSRRVRWVFHKTFKDTARLTVVSISPEECQDWWKKEGSMIDFQNEVIKFGFYLVRY